MSGWVALNVEPEDDNISEVDDTKEIQLEEAFKLYQTALKYHSQGPDFYQQAEDAYTTLFQSEVFRYPEALSEFDHDQLDDGPLTSSVPVDTSVVPVIASGTAESANSLPQLIYLAHKARAQFVVDQRRALQDTKTNDDRSLFFRHYTDACRRSLFDSAAALERDDTDLDLWKRAARVSDTLLTSRTVRFCLESVLAGDDENDDAIDLAGLDEAFAKRELELVLDQIQDNLTEYRISKIQPKSVLARLLRHSNDAYPFLPRSEKSEYISDDKRPLPVPQGSITSNCATTTYVGMTTALLETATRYYDATFQIPNNTLIRLDLPESESRMGKDMDMAEADMDSWKSDPKLSSFPSNAHSDLDADSPASFHSVPSEAIRISEPPPESNTDPQPTDPADVAQTGQENPDDSNVLTEPATLPSRKRSSTAAGNEEPEARSKSKRIKARESLAGPTVVDDEVQNDPSFIYRDQLASIEAADEETFKTVNSILLKIGVEDLGSIDSLRQIQDGREDSISQQTHTRDTNNFQTFLDLRSALKSWDETKYSAFTNGNGGRDHIEGSTGLSLFLKHSKAPLAKDLATPVKESLPLIRLFAEDINKNKCSVLEAVYLWLVELLTSGASRRVSPYLQGLWLPEMKQAISSIIELCHEDLVERFVQKTKQRRSFTGLSELQVLEFAQAIFELHLDVYQEMTNPASRVDQVTRSQQLNRLRVWAELAADTVQMVYTQHDESTPTHEAILLRFLWASVTFAKLSGNVDKNHILLCLHDLKDVFENSSVKEVILPNISALSSISSTALEQEISKVETLEFFMGVFDSDNSDPYNVIMKLEPILEYSEQPDAMSPLPSESEREQIVNFRAFLDSGDASLILFLWKRLQNAYTALSYNTKVVSCLLRSLEIVVREILASQKVEVDAAERELLLLRWIRDADEVIAKVLSKILDDKSAFDCIDELHLQSSTSAVVSLLRLIHVFVLTDDSLRVGSATPPSHRNATAHKHFEKCRDKFREMYVRLWTLLYLLIREAIVQMPNVFEKPGNDSILFLRSVHASLGDRQYCKQCNKLFVRITKGELFSLETEQDLSLDIAQIIFDLYQIRLSAGYGDADHGCSGEALEKDKRTAHDLVPIIMEYVQRLNVKDLLRSDIKSTIDRIQSALGQAKPSTALTFNRKSVSAYLKSLINPQRMFKALKGIGEIEYKRVHGEFEKIASQGWYLLLGNMTLAKYRSVKRVNPTPTDDLDNALSYLRQDLEHNPMKSWESWYRLAQVYDAKIEDCLIWNSNKLNEGRVDLATLERNAINAYTMAAALALKAADDDSVPLKLLNDMFFEFATRLYSSSRPPLDMEAFNTDKTVRHLSNYVSQEMSIVSLIRPMQEYMVWTFAAHLIRRSLSGDSKPWIRYYMLGKCLWKMFRSNGRQSSQRPVEVEAVIDAFSEAVERVPKKEKSSDPILEPHFKLVSIVHKLQDAKIISFETAVEYLQVTPYASNIQLPEDDQGKPDWERYILSIIEKLQKADKSGWHHRITARAAHVIWDNEQSIAAAIGARHKFADSIFTKNMTMQVWKPENERPGRHYVYTGRYLRFFIEILNVLKDRSNLEQVVRKIRRKTTDFINHTKVWEDAVTVYIDLLRQNGDVPRGRDRGLFDNITFDEFTKQSEKLEKWAHEPDTTSKYLDLLHDAIEMKKLNNSLSKSSVIDDLIGDAYACMYEQYVSQLPPEEQVQPVVPVLPQGTFINMNTETVPTGDDNRDRMRLNNLLSSQTDGASPEVPTRPAGLGIITNIPQGTHTPPSEAIRVPAPSKPGRVKTITRREVQKKAEALISKPPPIKTPTLSKKPLLVNIPSIRKSESQDRNDNDDGLAKVKANIASAATSRRGSASRRNSAGSEAADIEDDGGDGDNEEEDEDEEEEDDEENEASDSDGGAGQAPRRRLFPALIAAAAKTEDENEEEDDEDDDREADDMQDEEEVDSEADKMSDVQVDHGRAGQGPEIPDSQS